MENLIKEVGVFNICYDLNVNLSELTWLKTGGTALAVLYPKNTNELVNCVKILKKCKLTYKVIGGTSNLLFLDEIEYTCLLSTKEMKEVKYISKANEFIVGSGFMLPDFSRFALYNGVTGYEGLEGIPGTMGGAVYMNAGAYGYEIKDVLKSIEIVDYNGEIRIYKTEELDFKNRHSALSSGNVKGIVAKCWFDASKKEDTYLIESRMELYHSKRHKYLEYMYPNLGSIFSGSIYRVLGYNDKYTYFMSSIFYFFNYRFKIFRRESPINRKWINDIVVKRFNLKFEGQPFSNKSINSLVNRGQGTSEMVKYIREIQKLTNNKVPLENEIVEKF